MTGRMRILFPFIASVTFALPVAASVSDTAITAFNAWCFKAGQTSARIRANMERSAGAPLPFTLTFWDVSIEPASFDTPEGIERRCEVAFDGTYTTEAINALRVQMGTPPIFGSQIPLPGTHRPVSGTALIEGRELLRGRVAVVHVGMRDAQTFIAVDRLFDGLGLPKKDP